MKKVLCHNAAGEIVLFDYSDEQTPGTPARALDEEIREMDGSEDACVTMTVVWDKKTRIFSRTELGGWKAQATIDRRVA